MEKLELIAAGNVSAAEARSILAGLDGTFEFAAARKLVGALRAWTWKALDQKRRDPELREWHDVMKRAQLRVRPFEKVVAQIQVLLDLIYESVAVAERRPPSEVVKRRNAKTILSLLNSVSDRSMNKAELLRRLSLKQANLSRLMNVMIGAGLIERSSDGREAVFRLSRAGQDQAERLGVRPAINHDADTLQNTWFLNLKKDFSAFNQGTVFFGHKAGGLGPTVEAMVKSMKVGAAAYRDEEGRFGNPLHPARTILPTRSDKHRSAPAGTGRMVISANG